MRRQRRGMAVVVGTVVAGTLGLPIATGAGASPLATDSRLATARTVTGEVVDPPVTTLTDGAPPPETPTAEIGTREGPAATPGQGERPHRPAVASEVRDALVDHGTVPVIIRLRHQVDVGRLATEARTAGREGDRAARVATVVRTLRNQADATQDPVRRLLETEQANGWVTDVRSFWIINGFAATLSAGAVDRLAAHPDVESITLDHELSLPEPTAGEPRLPTWGLESVRAPDVWGEQGFTGDGVVVGVMDGGVDGSHPALASRYRGRDGDHVHSWYAATGENYPTPHDGNGHGTHVTGTILGGPPGEVTGVAPDAEWIAVKVFRDSGTTSASIIHAGFEWMLAPGGDPAMAPAVVNNSWGSAATNDTEFWEDVNAWLAAGIFPNFAAGNGGPGPGSMSSPGSFPHALSVGATDIHDQIAPFSSRGPVLWDGVEHRKPEVTGPGHEILSTWPLPLDDDGDGYHTISGTSMATPHVTGVVALLLSARPDLSVDALRELLESTARAEPHMGTVPNNDYGRGIVDAYEAITAARFSGTVTGTVTGPDGPLAATVAVPELGVSTTSDPASGFYELRLRQGTWTVEVGAYGFVADRFEVTIEPDDQLTHDVALAAAPTYTVSGSVTSVIGETIPDAVVRAVGTPLAAVYSDPAGAYALEIAAGTYQLSAEATGYQRRTVTLTVAGNETVDFELPPLDVATAPEWAEYQNNPRRSGYSPAPLAPDALTQAWQVGVSGRALFGSPVIAGGRAYLATDAGRLFALDLDDGTIAWSFTASTNFRTTPAIADGRVYFGGGDDGIFYAVDAESGEPQWTYGTSDRLTYTTPTIVDGRVYFGTGWGEGNGGWVYALDAATGALVWRTFIGAQIFFAPAVADGMVFAASYDAGRLVALDADTGEERWALARDSDSFAAIPTYAQGVVYIGTGDFDTGAGSILAVDAATGALRWEAAGHGDAAGSAPIVHGDLVIVGSNINNWVAAYDRATGAPAWVSPIGSAVSNGQLAADGLVVGGSQQDHRAWAIDAYTGGLRWEVTLDDNVLAAPALADGRLVVATRSGQVTAFEAPGTVTGVITDDTGEPLGATVRIAVTGVSVTSDPATGAYTLTHRPGAYTLDFDAYGFVRASLDITIRSGRMTTHDVTLVPGMSGALAGTVGDEAGAPLAGVEVALPGTPLAPVVTGADGGYAFADVVEGTYELNAMLDGYVPFATSVAVDAGATTDRDIELLQYQIAVTGDHDGELTRQLTADGYRTESTTMAAVSARPGDYELIVANGAHDDPGADTFLALLANADAAGTSIVFLDTWGVSYGSLLHLSRYTGDPTTTGSGYSDGEVSVIARADHPLTAGLTPGTRIELLPPDTEYAWFAGYGGRSVADLYVGDHEVVGSAIAYQPRSQGSVHVLLGAHGVSPWTGPTNGWQPAAHRVFQNAVSYALDARFGTVQGTITDAATGAPLPAAVTVAETGESTTAGADGTFQLLLPAGTYTLRVEQVGYASHEVTITVADGGTTPLDAELAPSGLGAISGTVSSGGEAVGAATVAVIGTELSATTDGEGRFTVDDVPGGTYQLEARAVGYLSATVDGVEVAAGEVTEVAIELPRALRVAVIGDRDDVVADEITTFLTANQMVASATGWEAIDQLDQYDVVIVHDPDDPGEAAFLDALARLDAAGVSAVFIEGALTADGGVRLLRNHLGNPTGRDFVSNDGNPEFHATDPGHRLFAGVTSPVQVLVGDEWGGYFTGYDGITLADFGTDELGVVGVGAAYEPRTPTSVRLLLSGLSASSLASPSEGWTADGGRVFLNALAWAAAPGLGAIDGRVTSPAGEPVAAVTATVLETGVTVAGHDDGTFTLAHPPGPYTLEVRAFGYVSQQQAVTITANRTDELTVELAVGDVGEIAGTVTDRETGVPIAGAVVELAGLPRRAVTGDDGGYVLPTVEAGTHTVRAEAPGHVRQLFHDVVVTAGAATDLDLPLRPSPRVAVIDDFEGRAAAYLTEWGYLVDALTWADTAQVAAYELIIANLASFPNLDPGAAGWSAFEDAVNRAHAPVIWLDQFGRGSIRWLSRYDGDPDVRGEGRSDGTVEARVVADHPLVAGFDVDDLVPLAAPDQEYGFFDGYSGVTVANLVTADEGERGGTIAYRGRTSESVDVLLSTLSISTYGYPAIGGQPAENWTPEAEVLFHNALAWTLDAPPLAGEAHGVVTSSATAAPIASAVTVVETGETFAGRDGDGTFLVPLQPGTWTLEVVAFGHDPATETATVAAGDTAALDIELVAHPTGGLGGTVTDIDGGPVPDASVTVVGTPLVAITAADGTYGFATVPVGPYTVRVQAAGYGVVERPVTIAGGETTTLDVTLAPSEVVAVAGDYQSGITSLLTANGYEVRPWSWADVDDHIGELGEIALVILNGSGTDPTADELNAFLAATAGAGVSVLMAGQLGNGAIREASAARGDPASVEDDFTDNGVGITYRPTAAHPIFDGFPVGDPIFLMREPRGFGQQYEWFSGYSGAIIAALGDEAAGDLGDGVGYRFTSPTSVEVLLDSLMSSVYGRPGERWSPAAEEIYLNAVAWAITATQAQIAGTVTSAGDAGRVPVAGAEVLAVEAAARTVTGADGAYRLGLPDGTHTIRVAAFGYEPFETTVTLAEGETRQLDVELTRTPRGGVAGVVVDAAGSPLAGAHVVLTGPQPADATTDEAGAFALADLVPGEYTLTVTAAHHVPATETVAVVAGETAVVDVTLTPNDVGVIGDVDGVLTGFLSPDPPIGLGGSR